MNKALLIGINKYGMEGADLNGCVNDVTNLRDVLLNYFGFTVEDIRVVVDGRATKKAIIERLKWLVKGAKAGDRLLFHYSGHGSQVRDRDGDELKDKMDEIICPHDMDWDSKTYIRDDELRKIFSGLSKGVILDVLLDSCYSGTCTREILAREKLAQGLSLKPRFLPPPADIQCRVDGDLRLQSLFHWAIASDPQEKRKIPERPRKLDQPMDHVLFSGCKENQTSADAEINGKYNGAFTYYLCKHLRDVRGDLSRSELIKRVRASLRFNDFDQVPQLEGPRAKFGKKVLDSNQEVY